MHVSHGPPGHKGVTQLMAIGDTDLEAGSTDRAIKKSMYAAAAVAVAGFLVGSLTVRNLGLGGYLALMAAQQMAGTANKVVPVSLAGPARAWTIARR